ncbi:hypothetical protein BDR26DRAFT_872758 [Obelidium mucronatum]|nr:hypothetical protein BDR26DRAFT_872758 [Obelidium mucronatum]
MDSHQRMWDAFDAVAKQPFIEAHERGMEAYRQRKLEFTQNVEPSGNILVEKQSEGLTPRKRVKIEDSGDKTTNAPLVKEEQILQTPKPKTESSQPFLHPVYTQQLQPQPRFEIPLQQEPWQFQQLSMGTHQQEFNIPPIYFSNAFSLPCYLPTSAPSFSFANPSNIVPRSFFQSSNTNIQGSQPIQLSAVPYSHLLQQPLLGGPFQNQSNCLSSNGINKPLFSSDMNFSDTLMMMPSSNFNTQASLFPMLPSNYLYSSHAAAVPNIDCIFGGEGLMNTSSRDCDQQVAVLGNTTDAGSSSEEVVGTVDDFDRYVQNQINEFEVRVKSESGFCDFLTE